MHGCHRTRARTRTHIHTHTPTHTYACHTTPHNTAQHHTISQHNRPSLTPTNMPSAQVLRVLRDSTGEMRRFLLSNRQLRNDTSSRSSQSEPPETRLALAVEQAASARRVEVAEFAPTRAGALSRRQGRPETRTGYELGASGVQSRDRAQEAEDSAAHR